jgi:hypothetical protein
MKREKQNPSSIVIAGWTFTRATFEFVPMSRSEQEKISREYCELVARFRDKDPPADERPPEPQVEGANRSLPEEAGPGTPAPRCSEEQTFALRSCWHGCVEDGAVATSTQPVATMPGCRPQPFGAPELSTNGCHGRCRLPGHGNWPPFCGTWVVACVSAIGESVGRRATTESARSCTTASNHAPGRRAHSRSSPVS